jgi:hypothetical protein
VKQCSAICGDGKIQLSEDCRNCSEDVKQCSAICGDGKIQLSEDCRNCSEDVKQCREDTCGNGILDVDA